MVGHCRSAAVLIVCRAMNPFDMPLMIIVYIGTIWVQLKASPSGTHIEWGSDCMQLWWPDVWGRVNACRRPVQGDLLCTYVADMLKALFGVRFFFLFMGGKQQFAIIIDRYMPVENRSTEGMWRTGKL